MPRAAALIRPFKAFAAAASALFLASCFVSHEPLVGPGETVTPLAEGLYAFHENDEDGESRLTWRGEVRVVDGVLNSPVSGFDYQGARLARLRTGVWIVQHPPEEAGDPFIFTLLYADPDNADRFYAEIPLCEALSVPVRASLGLTLVEDSCEIDSLETLREALRAYETEAADSVPPFPQGRNVLVREAGL